MIMPIIETTPTEQTHAQALADSGMYVFMGDVDEESSRLVQMPAENTLELINASETTQKDQFALNKSNLTLIQNQDSKLFPQKVLLMCILRFF